MTKEEILKSQIGYWAFDDVTDRHPGILTTMDEYAKQQSMDYLDFVLKRLVPHSIPVRKDNPDREVLYNQFMEQQNK